MGKKYGDKGGGGGKGGGKQSQGKKKKKKNQKQVVEDPITKLSREQRRQVESHGRMRRLWSDRLGVDLQVG